MIRDALRALVIVVAFFGLMATFDARESADQVLADAAEVSQ